MKARVRAEGREWQWRDVKEQRTAVLPVSVRKPMIGTAMRRREGQKEGIEVPPKCDLGNVDLCLEGTDGLVL